jgi:hypothetical protein
MMMTMMRLRQHLASSYPIYTSAIARIDSNGAHHRHLPVAPLQKAPPPDKYHQQALAPPDSSATLLLLPDHSDRLASPVRVMSASSPASDVADWPSCRSRSPGPSSRSSSPSRSPRGRAPPSVGAWASSFGDLDFPPYYAAQPPIAR